MILCNRTRIDTSLPTMDATTRNNRGLGHAQPAAAVLRGRRAGLAPSSAAPMARPSLADAVREEILRRIIDGAIAPGERIVELRVAQELGTSQAPVREALRGLEVLGVVESSRNRGARVRLLQPRELMEISDVRAELEGYAAGLAAPRLKGSTAELRSKVTAMRRAAKAKDVRRFAEANTAFHRLIVTAADNSVLLGIWSRLDVQSHTIMNVLRSHRDLMAVALSHQPIVAALEAGDARAARRATRAHILGNRLALDVDDYR